MKLNKLSLAVVASLASSAASATPGTHDIYLSSATALRDTMVRMVEQYCNTALPFRITERPNTIISKGVNNLDFPGDADFRVYECTLKPSSGAGSIPALANANHDLGGAFVRIHHTVKVNSALGGSIVGVMPIYRNIDMEFVTPPVGAPGTALPVRIVGDNTQVCVADGTRQPNTAGGLIWPAAKCKFSTGRIPEVGVSDTEPKSFAGPNLANPSTVTFNSQIFSLDNSTNPNEVNDWKSAIVPGELGNVTTNPFIIVGFGLALTNNLHNHPTNPIRNLSHIQIASLLSGGVDNWNEIAWSQDVSTGAPGDTGPNFRTFRGPNAPVKICRRTQGSGTQASWNAMANSNPCLANSEPFGFLPIADATTEGPHENGVIAGHNLTVVESASSSGVKSCLQAAHAAGELAIGLLSLENNESNASKNWQFVALDGVQPFHEGETVAQPDGVADRIREEYLTSGAYNYIQEPTIQWRNTLAGHALAFGEVLKDNAGTPSITKTLPGIVSLPFNAPVLGPTACDDASSGVSSVTRSGNSCQTATRSPVCGL